MSKLHFFPEQHQHKPTTKTFVQGQHARIQEFFVRWGGGWGESRLFNSFYHLQRGSNGFIKHFPGGGGPTFSRGGVQLLISIETHFTITCDFPGGGGGSGPPTPYPYPLDPHMENVAFWHE